MSDGTISNVNNCINVDQFILFVPNYMAKVFQTLKFKQGANSFEVYAIGEQSNYKPEMFSVAIE